MRSIFTDAMHAATELTRSGRLSEATRLVQAALVRSQRSAEAAEAGAENASASAGQNLSPRSPPSRRDRLRLPLGEVLELLRTYRPANKRPSSLSAPVPEGARVEARSFTCEAGSRRYELFIPSGSPRQRPLLVMLHGCTQDPSDFALGTGMNGHAAFEQVYVAYPGQDVAANQSACWNWFNRKDQGRSSTEPRILAGLTHELLEEFDIDPNRVFIAGLSAGGAMAAVMAATYPELYRGLGIHSGLAYGSADDVASAFSIMRGTTRPQPPRGHARPIARPRTIVFHGSADKTVHPSNGDRIIKEVEEQLANGLSTIVEGQSVGGRGYRRRLIHHGEISWAEHWLVEGGGHAWFGGNSLGSYTDPEGPDASAEMLRFFLRP